MPTAVKIFNWTATLYKGAVVFRTPMVYALGFLGLFLVGGLTGLFLSSMGLDVHLHDTYFVVAHFHYVMMGSTLIAFLGAMHYWWPKMFGRMYNEGVARVCAIIIFCAFNVTFLPQFVLGTRGMPRRYFDYDPQFEGLHQISTLGAFVMGVALFVALLNLVVAIKKGKKAGRNPWGSTTLE